MVGQAAGRIIGVKIREAAKIGAHLGLRYRWSDHVDEWYCGAGRDSFRFGLLTTGHRPEPPRGVPRVSFGSGTMHYVLAGSARNSRNRYPQGESGPDGCTRRWANAAAIKRASIQLLAVGPSREGNVSRCSKDFSRLKNSCRVRDWRGALPVSSPSP